MLLFIIDMNLFTCTNEGFYIGSNEISVYFPKMKLEISSIAWKDNYIHYMVQWELYKNEMQQ